MTRRDCVAAVNLPSCPTCQRRYLTEAVHLSESQTGEDDLDRSHRSGATCQTVRRVGGDATQKRYTCQTVRQEKLTWIGRAAAVDLPDFQRCRRRCHTKAVPPPPLPACRSCGRKPQPAAPVLASRCTAASGRLCLEPVYARPLHSFRPRNVSAHLRSPL